MGIGRSRGRSDRRSRFQKVRLAWSVLSHQHLGFDTSLTTWAWTARPPYSLPPSPRFQGPSTVARAAWSLDWAASAIIHRHARLAEELLALPHAANSLHATATTATYPALAIATRCIARPPGQWLHHLHYPSSSGPASWTLTVLPPTQQCFSTWPNNTHRPLPGPSPEPRG